MSNRLLDIITEQRHAMNTQPIYTVHFVNFDWKEPVQCDSFKQAMEVMKSKGLDAIVTDGMGEHIAQWSIIGGLKMVPNKYSA